RLHRAACGGRRRALRRGRGHRRPGREREVRRGDLLGLGGRGRRCGQQGLREREFHRRGGGERLMAVVAITGGTGAPGATTSALALLLAWPLSPGRRVLLA